MPINMKLRSISKGKNCYFFNVKERNSSRKAKSIKVSPVVSQGNTGCANSPKTSVSPVRSNLNMHNFISNYVTKALVKVEKSAKKRPLRTSAGHKRASSDGKGPEKVNNEQECHKASSHYSSIADKTFKKEALTEKTFSRDESHQRLFVTNDSEESIRNKLIEFIKNSFKSNGCAPSTSLDFYKVGRQIGNGAFGKVNLAVHRLTGIQVAIKTIERNFIRDEKTRRKIFQEVFIMKKIRHRNVIRLLEVFECNKNVMIVLEYAGGGDLLHILKSRGKLSEEEGKGIFFQVVEAVKSVHKSGVIHRDIKLDNILLNSDYTEIKLCDFGVSRFAKQGERYTEQCGTPAYLAPEIIANEGYEPFYVDIWSMGVLLYAMISASVPFKAKTLADLQKLILLGKYETPGYFSKELTDFIGLMLNPVPALRISLEEMQSHPWFSDFSPETFTDNSYSLTRQNEILKKMNGLGFSKDYIVQSLNLKDVNHASATYNLLDLSENS
jgi:serine/threonine protein kinase